MLDKDMEETKNNKVELKHFEDETVIKFVQYLYAHTTEGAWKDPVIRPHPWVWLSQAIP